MESACSIFEPFVYFLYAFVLLAAMGPTVEVVEVEVEAEVEVEVAVAVAVAVAALIRGMVSHLARVTASRDMEATTRALTAAPAPTTREDMAAMVKPSQVEKDSVNVRNQSHTVL